MVWNLIVGHGGWKRLALKFKSLKVSVCWVSVERIYFIVVKFAKGKLIILLKGKIVIK